MHEVRPRHVLWSFLVACGVCVAASGSPRAATAANFADSGRWTATVTDGSGLQRGDPLTLTWGIVPDGTTIIDPFAGGATRPSNFISFLDGHYGGAPGGANPNDLTLRPWFAFLQDSIAIVGAKTGISYVYQPDDGAGMGAGGMLGVRGDVRIGGIDIAGGILGFNGFPDSGGDMVMDTGSGNPFGNVADLQNVFLHEHGHGLGLGHVNVPNANVMIEANRNGPQYDDLFALQRMYGDKYEKNGGNDTAATAVALGNPVTAVRRVGGQAADQTILAAETDVVSIDGVSDSDVYKFTVTGPTEVNLSLTPRGPTYNFTPEGGASQTHTGVSQSDLRLDVLALDGATRLARINFTGLGGSETVPSLKLPAAGDYYVRIAGQQDAAQMYELELSGVGSELPANANLIFHDSYAVDGGAAANPNSGYSSSGRQAGRVVNSLYQVSSSDTTAGDGDASVSIEANQLRLASTGDGSGPNQAAADLVRNFAPQLIGKKWAATFNVDVSGDVGIGDSWFGFTFNDEFPPSGPFADSAEMSMLVRLNGAVQIKENAGNAAGEASFLGSAPGTSHEISLVIDETAPQPLMDVIVDGITRISDEPITLAQQGRYFSFRAHVGSISPAGLAFNARVDDFGIKLISPAATAADFDSDGDVDAGDLTVWRQNFGGLPIEGGDADGNNFVDGADFLAWQRSLGVGVSASAAAVPEPGGTLMAIILLLTPLAAGRTGQDSRS